MSAQLLRAQLRRGHAADLLPPPTSSTCCTGRTTAPRRSRRSRRAACRSTCRCGIWCRRTRRRSSANCCGSSIRATAATIRSTRPKASGATRASSTGSSSTGVAAWPRLESGQLDIDSDAFRMMYHMPGIEGLHALRDSLGVIVRARAADRPRRAQPAELVSVLHRHRPQRARQEPVQRPRRHALVHGVPARHDRRLSRLAHAGSRHRRRRCPAIAALMADYRGGDVYHALARAVRPHRRSGPDALEEAEPGRAAADEVAAARRSITAWACRRWRAGSTGIR